MPAGRPTKLTPEAIEKAIDYINGGYDVAMLSVDKIIPYARNPRKNEAAVDKVAASLKEFGWRQPIVVDPECVIIAGHTRYQAAKRLGMTEVPAHIAEGLTDAQIKAYRLADNRSGQEAEWDIDLLAIELGDLADLDVDLNLTGFTAGELDLYMRDPDFEPGTAEDQGKLDELAPKYVDCPHCGKEFDLREQS